MPAGVIVSPITPANQTKAPGNQTFNATATGGATDNITWTATGGTFVGSVWTSPNTAGTYTITAASADEPSVFTTTTVTVSAPVITTQPVSLNVCSSNTSPTPPNTSASLSVVAKYASSYQWNLNKQPITGATSSSYFIASADPSIDAGDYTVTVTNPAGSVTSAIATLVVGSSITSQPSNASVYATQTATFSVVAGGPAPFTYQWYRIPTGSSTGTAIAGATSSSYTTPALAATSNNGDQYYVTVKDICGAVTSSNAKLTVASRNVPPTIITQPQSVTVSVGATPMLTVVASGSPSLSYQWYQIPAGSAQGTYVTIAGANLSTYTVPSSNTHQANDQDAYFVTVSNSYGQAVSQQAILAVGNGILIHPTACQRFRQRGSFGQFHSGGHFGSVVVVPVVRDCSGRDYRECHGNQWSYERNLHHRLYYD